MKLLCNGFNLFRQLNVNKPIIKELTNLFEFEVIKQVSINQSYTIIATENDYLLYDQEGVSTLNSLLPDKIKLLASNDEKIIFLDIQGKLWKSYLGNFKTIESFDNFVCSNNLIHISVGCKLTVIYLSDGSFYNIPNKLNFTHSDILDVKCGKEHCLILDNSGNVYSFGTGSRGQLGHGKLDDEAEPQLVEGLAGIKINKIAAGGWHSCAVSQDGDLYVWGWNSNGQLGLGKEEEDKDFVSVMASPHVVDFPCDNLNAVLIACGSRHTIIFMDNKHLYGCGWNKYYQLLNNEQENYYKLTDLHGFPDDNVLNLHCGPWNSAVHCK